jgi:uncharacterized protein (DUF983 family)
MDGESRWSAILRRKCPRCLEGNVYRGWFRPLEACPSCGLVYEREPGYFLGSFYISYALGVAVGIPTVLVVLYADLPFYWLFPLVAVWVGILSPLIVTYARTLWYHFDHVVDPR